MSQKNRFGIACKTCRHRGRKCDRKLPKCLNCSLRGTVCEGYVLRWVHATLETKDPIEQLRGVPKETTLIFDLDPSSLSRIRTGNTRRVEKYAAAQSWTTPISTSMPYICEHVVQSTNYPTTQAVHSDSFMQRSWYKKIPGVLAGDDLEDLVKYYIYVISPVFNLDSISVDTLHDYDIATMARAVPSIRCVVAATAASHLANQLADDHLRQRSLHLRLQSTELLRAKLESHPEGPDLTQLLCILLLAQLDVCSGDCVEFGIHLKAGTTFIKQRGIEIAGRSHIEQRLAWLDVMDATTNLRLPFLTLEDIKAILDRFHNSLGERVWGLDVFSCPVDLFEQLANVVVLYGSQSRTLGLSEEAVVRAANIVIAVRDWSSSTSLGSRYHLNELPDKFLEGTHLTNRIFFHARCIPSNSNWSYSMTWPLFHAGLLLLQGEIRTKAWLQNELDNNFKMLGCSHQKFAADTLEKVWQSENNQSIGSHGSDTGIHKLMLY